MRREFLHAMLWGTAAAIAPFVILLIAVCFPIKRPALRDVFSVFLTAGATLGTFWSWDLFHSIVAALFMADFTGFLILTIVLLSLRAPAAPAASNALTEGYVRKGGQNPPPPPNAARPAPPPPFAKKVCNYCRRTDRCDCYGYLV